MYLFKLLGVKTHTGIDFRGRAIEAMRMSFYVVKGWLHQFKEFLVIHVAGRTQHNSIWVVTTVQVFKNHFPGKALYRLDIAEDRTCKWIPIPKSPIKKYVNILIGCIFHHIYFLEDHLSLALYFPIIKYGMKKDIREYVYYKG